MTKDQRPGVRRGGRIGRGQRLGDLIFRRNRAPAPQTITIKPRSEKPIQRPTVVFLTSVVVIILAGMILLMLPVSSASGEWTSFQDALFMSTSCVAVTGLTVVDTGTYWSTFGHVVILVLVQIGGLGFMTSASLLLSVFRQQATLSDRVLLKEAVGSKGIGSTISLARRIIAFTFITEGVAAFVLTFGFWSYVPGPEALWWGVFNAITAFNNVGFDLVGNYRSMTPFQESPVVLITLSVTLMLGGISYAVVNDLYRARHFRQLSVDTKLVLSVTAVLIVLGTFGIIATEWANDRTLGSMDLADRLLNGMFTSLSVRSAGFNSVDIAALSDNGLFLLTMLMFIGASAGSTAGGIKVQTVGVLWFTMVATARGRRDIEAFQRRIPPGVVQRSIAITLLAVLIVVLVTMILSFSEPFGFLPLLFEAVSALGTVGISTGITPAMSPFGRWLLILCMFAGRIGPLALVLVLTAREHPIRYRRPEESVRIG